MQENEQGYPKQQNEKRNPELAVCKDGFEHTLSLCREFLPLPAGRFDENASSPLALYAATAKAVKMPGNIFSLVKNHAK